MLWITYRWVRVQILPGSLCCVFALIIACITASESGREKPWERGCDARADHVQIGVFCLSSCFFEVPVAVGFR